MPATVTHNLSATTPDDPAYEIRPSHWNSAHAVTVNATGSEISGAFNNGGGVTFGLETNGFITAAAPAGAPSPVNFSAGTTSNNLGSVVFSNSNGISWGLNGSTITGTVRTDYLTTAALSNHSHGNPTLALTNLSGTTDSNSAGLTLSLSAAQTGGLTQTHNSAHHSGTIFPQDVNQAMGSAFLDIGTIAEPASPAANVLRMYIADQNGHAVMEVKGAAGLTRRLARDSIIIARVDEAGGVVKGEAVYISGAVGANELIKKARADSDTTMPAVGLVLEDGALNAFVRVLFSGKATELNTSAFTIGDRVFVSETTAGALTTVSPPHPNLRQRIGIVTRVNTNNGEIIVTPHIVRGDHDGTNKNLWLIGDALAGAKSVGFRNANSGDLAWNPTANRTLHLPDGNGTLLTTAALSNHSHGDPTLALTNLSGTTASNSAGLTLSLSAGAGGAGDGGNVLAADTRTATTLGTVLFSNSNGVSFGLDAPNGTRMTASHDGLTSQSNQALSGQNGSFTFQTASFSNANNVSFGTSAGPALTASIPAGATATGNLGGIVGSNATYTSGTVTITGVGGGITVSSNTGQRIDLSVAAPVAQTNQTVGRYGLQNTTGQSSSSTADARSLSYAGLGIVSVGHSAGSGLIVSATQSNQAASASNGSFTFQTLGFSNANNVTFGTSAGSIVTASVAAGGGGNFSAGVSTGGNTSGSTGVTGTRLVFAGSNNITLSQSTDANGGTITVSGYSPGGVVIGGNTAGTTASITSGTMTIAGGNNVTISQAGGNAITVSAGAGGAAGPDYEIIRFPQFADSASQSNLTNLTAMTNRPFFVDVRIPGNIDMRSLGFRVSRAATGSNQFTVRFGVYTFVNSTSINLLGSTSGAFSATSTAAGSAQRNLFLTGITGNTDISRLAGGNYVFGFHFSAAATASMNYSLMGWPGGSVTGSLPQGNINEGSDSYETATTDWAVPFQGRFTTTTAELPAGVTKGQIWGLATGTQMGLQPILTIRAS